MRRQHHQCKRRGATLVLICILMIVLVAMVAFAVDVGRVYLVRSQLQSAVDSGALAASLQLRNDPNDIDAAVAAAEDFVQHNRVGWLTTVPDSAITVQTGSWDSATNTFTAGGISPDAVRVAAEAIDEPLFFANVMGHSKLTVPRDAIAKGGGAKLDIMLTLDLSGSMSKQGRIDALRAAAPEFVNILEEAGDDDRIGVMGYGAMIDKYSPGSPGHNGAIYTQAPQALYPNNSEWAGVLEAPLTDDFAYLTNTVLGSNTLLANKYNGWTPIGASLRDSSHYLSTNARDDVDLVIVLMSDGHANKPAGNGPGYALEMADYAAGLGIKVYTISCGNAADDDLMAEIAARTGGEFFQAAGSAGTLADKLTEAFRNVAEDIKRNHLVK